MKTIAISLAALFIIACGPGSQAPAPSSGKPRVAAVNFPLAEFASAIGGDHIDVHFPQIEGDPALWKPTAEEIRTFQSADLILLNGADYAKRHKAASLPPAKTVDTSAGFRGKFITVKDAKTHKHGKTGEHSHAGTAFTTWLDLKLALQQAGAIHARLIKLLPDHETEITANYRKLETDLRALDTELTAVATQYKNMPLLGSHPVYQYLARGYGLDIKSLHWEPDTMPDEAGWTELENITKTHPAALMLWEDEPTSAIAEKLKKDHGITGIIFNPGGNRSENKLWLEGMQENIARLKAGAPKK